MKGKIQVLLLVVILVSSGLLKAQIPSKGQVLWLRASDGIKANGKGAINTWADQSPAKNDAKQTVTKYQPLLIKNGIGQQPVVRFDGGTFLNCPTKFPVRSGYTIITVMKVNNYNSYNTIVGGSSQRLWWMLYSSQPQYYQNGVTTVISSQSTPSNFSVVGLVNDDSAKQSRIYINGQLSSSGADTLTNIDSTMAIGAFVIGGTPYWNFIGEMAEVIIYKRKLNPSEITNVYDYLNNKYKLNKSDSNVVLDKFPKYNQFYARDKSDSAVVPIAGKVVTAGFDSVKLNIYRNDTLWKSFHKPLSYTSGLASFDLSTKIRSELAEYSFELNLSNSKKDTLVAFQKNIVCGDFFIINGQSNSITNSIDNTYQNEFCRTYGVTTPFSYNTNDTSWGIASGATYSSYSVGSWGMKLMALMISKEKRPICIINGGVGGTSIQQQQRISSNPTDLNTIYGRLLYRIKKAQLDTSAKALFWYQGESNGPDDYAKQFHALYNSWKGDYASIKKIYTVQIHTGCYGGSHLLLREFQRGIKDTLKDVEVMSVNNIDGHDGCHYNLAGYSELGIRLYRQLQRDFYNNPDTLNIDPPNLQRAFFMDSAHTKIGLLFREKNAGLKSTKDTIISSFRFNIRHAFYINDSFGKVKTLSYLGDTIVLTLLNPTSSNRLTYIPDHFYENTPTYYQGPWLVNRRGIGALIFYNFTIEKFIPKVHAVLDFRFDSICFGKNTAFNDLSTIKYGSIIKHHWDFGDGDSTNIQQPTHKYLITGSYKVTLTTLSDRGLKDTFSKFVVIDPLPNAVFSDSNLFGNTFDFKPLDSTLISYLWDFGDGTFSNLREKKYTYSNYGKYKISLKVRNNKGCENYYSDSILLLNTGIQLMGTIGDLQLGISPNPVNENTLLTWTIKGNMPIRLTLTDVRGVMIKELVNKNCHAGDHSYMVDSKLMNLAGGIYYVVIESGVKKVVRKMVVND